MIECIDCAALPRLPEDGTADPENVEYRPRVPRPAPHGGPRSRRCTTHYRAHRKAAKARIHERRVQKVYGLTEGEYAALYAFQGGRCAICQRATGQRKKLAVDHDHVTGRPRGLCCVTCNYVILGRYGAEALQRAIDYLQAPPYEQMRSAS